MYVWSYPDIIVVVVEHGIVEQLAEGKHKLAFSKAPIRSESSKEEDWDFLKMIMMMMSCRGVTVGNIW